MARHEARYFRAGKSTVHAGLKTLLQPKKVNQPAEQALSLAQARHGPMVSGPRLARPDGAGRA